MLPDEQSNRVAIRLLVAGIDYMEKEIAERLRNLRESAAHLARQILPDTDPCHPDYQRSVWLIERGQPEGQSPLLWWTGKAWNQNAVCAKRYKTKADAETEIEANSGIAGIHRVFGRATEHLFIDKEKPLCYPGSPATCADPKCPCRREKAEDQRLAKDQGQ